MQQVLGKLLSNARKYTPDGGGIRLAARVTGAMAEVSVTDSGLGIPGESLPHVFGNFYRVAAPGRQSIRGTGLGLAIVGELVEMQGGTVGVESEGMGKGSRFWFSLPIVASETEPGGDVQRHLVAAVRHTLTPALKLERRVIAERYAAQIDALYV